MYARSNFPYEFCTLVRERTPPRGESPMKFLILAARAQAWKQVLLDRGWAVGAPPVRWARQGQPNDTGIVLSSVPVGPIVGAVPEAEGRGEMPARGEPRT